MTGPFDSSSRVTAKLQKRSGGLLGRVALVVIAAIAVPACATPDALPFTAARYAESSDILSAVFTIKPEIVYDSATWTFPNSMASFQSHDRGVAHAVYDDSARYAEAVLTLHSPHGSTSQFRGLFLFSDLPVQEAETGGGSCCVVCVVGKACGNSCISRSKTCHVGPGCACNAAQASATALANTPIDSESQAGSSLHSVPSCAPYANLATF
jgi:hypothetical protein